jgi:hypothetical protein
MLDTKVIDAQVEKTAQTVVLDAVRAQARSITLSDLLKLSESHPFLAGMTVSELGSGAKRGPGRPKANGKVSKESKGKVVASDVDTRDKEGRDQYRRMVLQIVQRNPGISAQGVREKAGGTELQARTALNYFVKEGSITFEGATRNRVYSPKAS